jgi:ABC-2 type transport system permease protein
VLAAQLIVDAGMTAVTMIALLVVARLAFGVAFPRQPTGFALAVMLGALALLSLGLLLASVLPTSRGANAAGAILFFPMMCFAGLWLPIAAMPAALRHVSHATPLGAAGPGYDRRLAGPLASAVPADPGRLRGGVRGGGG